MALAGRSFEAVKALIDRGIAADDTRPPGTGYLVRTSDQARNVRALSFDRVQATLGRAVRLEQVKTDALTGKPDVLFYFTGAAAVPQIETNRFRPGAVADHLTSTGGQLTDSRQMSSLRWLEAGATGSYGAVVEPCNFPEKFPDPGVLIAAYVTGATLIEAYWQSVQMPGQGIFIGEPLARPFGGYTLTDAGDAWVLTTYALRPGTYRLEGADDPMGPYRHPRVLPQVRVRPAAPAPAQGRQTLTCGSSRPLRPRCPPICSANPRAPPAPALPLPRPLTVWVPARRRTPATDAQHGRACVAPGADHLLPFFIQQGRGIGRYCQLSDEAHGSTNRVAAAPTPLSLY